MRDGTKNIEKKCPICGIMFYTFLSINAITCSRTCSNKYTRQKTYEKRKKNCIICGKEFLPKHTKTLGIYCSYKCQGIASRKTVVYRSGYNYIFMPTHPNSNKQGYYQEHKYIMEKYIGRILDKKEIVHHINHKKNDNRIENLMILNDSIHRRYHAKKRVRNNKGEFTHSF